MGSKTLRELTIKLDADVAELKKGLAKANKQLSGFQKRMKGIGQSFKNILPVLAVGAVVSQVGELVGEMSMLGKELEGVKAGFSGIDPKVLDDMRKATHGTVTDLELMKQAVQFKNFGLPVKELGSMLEFVHRRARTSGQSVKFLADSLVTGLGRKSVLIIDNLGISASQLNAELKKTPDFTEAVAKIMKRDMIASGAYIETAADITERWAAEWQNTKAEVGLFINKGIKLIAPVLDGLKKDMAEWLGNTAKGLFDLTNKFIRLHNTSMVFRALIQGLKFTFKSMVIIWNTATETMADGIVALGKIMGFAFNPLNWGKGFGTKLKKLAVDGFAAVKNEIKEGGNDFADAWTSSIEGLDNRIKMLVWNDETTEAVVKQATDAGTKTGEAFTRSLAKNMKAFQKEMKNVFKGGKDKGIEFIDESDMDAAANEIIENVKEASNKVQLEMGSVNNFLADSFAQLGQNIGKSLSGTGKLLDGFMNILLGFGEQFGKIMIGIGVAKLALENIGISGIGAIVAGISLIAGISAIRGLMKKGPGFAGGGIVPGSSFSGDNVPINTNSGELILNRAQQGNVAGQLAGGRGGKLIAVVSGSDLKFILDEANRMDNNSF